MVCVYVRPLTLDQAPPVLDTNRDGVTLRLEAIGYCKAISSEALFQTIIYSIYGGFKDYT